MILNQLQIKEKIFCLPIIAIAYKILVNILNLNWKKVTDNPKHNKSQILKYSSFIYNRSVTYHLYYFILKKKYVICSVYSSITVHLRT